MEAEAPSLKSKMLTAKEKRDLKKRDSLFDEKKEKENKGGKGESRADRKLGKEDGTEQEKKSATSMDEVTLRIVEDDDDDDEKQVKKTAKVGKYEESGRKKEETKEKLRDMEKLIQKGAKMEDENREIRFDSLRFAENAEEKQNESKTKEQRKPKKRERAVTHDVGAAATSATTSATAAAPSAASVSMTTEGFPAIPFEERSVRERAETLDDQMATALKEKKRYVKGPKLSTQQKRKTGHVTGIVHATVSEE